MAYSFEDAVDKILQKNDDYPADAYYFIRAALDAVTDYGRPALIRLAVLVDRGGVEYPIRADYTGWTMQAGADRKILVEFSEEDGADGVYEVAWQRNRN